jgi:hypothetical protein
MQNYELVKFMLLFGSCLPYGIRHSQLSIFACISGFRNNLINKSPIFYELYCIFGPEQDQKTHPELLFEAFWGGDGTELESVLLTSKIKYSDELLTSFWFWAVRLGSLERVRILRKVAYFDVGCIVGDLIVLASSYGHYNVFDYLVGLSLEVEGPTNFRLALEFADLHANFDIFHKLDTLINGDVESKNRSRIYKLFGILVLAVVVFLVFLVVYVYVKPKK